MKNPQWMLPNHERNIFVISVSILKLIYENQNLINSFKNIFEVVNFTEINTR